MEKIIKLDCNEKQALVLQIISKYSLALTIKGKLVLNEDDKIDAARTAEINQVFGQGTWEIS